MTDSIDKIWQLSAFADEASPSTTDQILALQTGGIKWIDPRTVDGHNITELPLETATEVAKAYAAADIRVNMFGSPIGKTDIADPIELEIQRLEHLARLKDIFDCNRVRIFSFYNAQDQSKEQFETIALDKLKQLIDAAKTLGLVLYHENETDVFGDHPDDVLEIAELRGDQFKLIYDFANYLRTGADPVDTWEELAPYTDAFHFKDQCEDGQHVPIGFGDTAARAILKDAVRRGWSGPVTVEPHLTHSEAVLVTNVSGSGDTRMADLPPAETFNVACQAARELIEDLGVTLQ